MTRKVFTLVDGRTIHVGPKVKIIPAEEFSKIIAAEEVLLQAEEDAVEFKKQVAIEGEGEKEVAKAAGFEEGLKQWAEQLAYMEEELAKMRKETQKMIIPVALQAAKKIVGKEISLSEEIVVDIVANSLKSVAQHKKVTVYVNKADLDILEKHKEKLKQLFENLEFLSIRPREDVTKASCVIETEVGIINARIEHLWDVLEQAFYKFMQKEKSS